MDKQAEKKWARALGAEDTALLPYIPYLLQDLHSLGTPIKPILNLIKKHIPNTESLRVLDLGCGKGNVGLPIAKEFGASVYFVDAMSEFVEYTKNKAKEMQIKNCSFKTEDINITVKQARDFDIVLLCSVGDVFGKSKATIKTLKQTIKKGGYIIFEESYKTENTAKIKCEYDFETLSDWLKAFEISGVKIVAKYDEWLAEDEIDFDYDNKHIAKRAAELSEKYPDKKELFDGYIKSQLNECEDLETLQTCIWLLQAE